MLFHLRPLVLEQMIFPITIKPTYSTTPSTTRLSEIAEAIEPILTLNPGYRIDRLAPDHLEITCGDAHGIYTIKTDHTLHCLGVQSPVSGDDAISMHFSTHPVSLQWSSYVAYICTPTSGLNRYAYDPVEEIWVGVHDGHDLRGLITRDFLRHCIGLPQFPSTR